ncbi:MAG TPA: malonic semialdehyde reductase [Candidatus Binataceae bacterium]|nr:malonic semialdehyde reductase [Candidatus Binataceae bacterium]
MLDEKALDVLFRTARSHNGWLDRPVSDAELHALYELVKWGPTSANCSPMRLVFVRTPAGKERVRPALSPNNVEKTLSAPVVVIVANDSRFHEFGPRLFPRNPAAAERFASDPALAAVTALRNGTLQGGYLILAARALGLDCGPMSGFDNGKIDAEFFPDGRFKSNFLCGLGHGDPARVFPRGPRLTFEEACTLA